MKTDQRFTQLDSLRGLAALFVVFLHISLIFPETHLSKLLLEYSPLRLLVSGSEAVILFFVLSGFVLSRPFYTNSNSNYFTFLIKRILRIYSPYIFAVILSILCARIFYQGKIEGLSDWFNVIWTGKISGIVVTDHLLLVKTFLSNLNPVIWSLVHEMRISIIFPLIMIFIVKMNWKKGVLFGISLSLLSTILFLTFKVGNDGVEMINTLHYTSMFVLGAIISKYFSSITNRVIKMSRIQKFLLFGFGIMMYIYAKPSFVIATFIYPDIAPFYRTVLDSWFVAVGSMILIVFSVSSRLFSKILTFSPIRYLGKISYSLYLSHILVLVSMFQLLHGAVPVLLICLLSLVTSIAISSLMYHFIELPSITLSKRLTKKIGTFRNTGSEIVPKSVVK
jgi:peptidoglycan/LPS O-acetylase OafA/YrhL